jgi:hypothetical protein
MPEGQTPDERDDFGSEPTPGARGAEGAERAQEERPGHVSAGPEGSATASANALPRAGKPVDRTPLRHRFSAQRGATDD